MSLFQQTRRLALAGSLVTLMILPAAAPSRAQTTELTYDPSRFCGASTVWVDYPAIPGEIPGGGTNFCQFYQYSWQTFLYLVAPNKTYPLIRNFESQADFPTLQADANTSCSNALADSAEPVRQFFARTTKSDKADTAFITPERINQAGDGATIYDQYGNVVFYTVRFSRDMCTAPLQGDLPAGTTELKLAWKVLHPEEVGGYYTIPAIISTPDGNKPYLLGLIGFHIVRTTPEHPEAVWITMEHQNNATECAAPELADWSFTSPSTVQCLQDHGSCAVNNAKQEGPAALTGTPTEICSVYRNGTDPADPHALENNNAVDQLNWQLVGPNGILSRLPDGDPMRIWKNYFMRGAVWVSDPSKASGSADPSGNQRGSLELANTVMETTFQGSFDPKTGARGDAVNCFACHDYTPNVTAELNKTWSHILDDIR